jgi:type III pantothenate kinase
LFIAGANIERFLIYPKQFLKKIYLYLCLSKFKNMLLAIDVGNTQIKLAVFEHHTLIHKEIIAYNDWQIAVKKNLKKFSKIENIVVASVGKLNKEDFLELNSNVKIYFITKESTFPFQNLYATPDTLGIDRMVLAAGAVLQFPNKNRLVIDAGTCITYDFIDENDNYLGGAISPGIRLRYESLHNYTAKLPLLTKENPDHLIGNSTNQSIHSGVVNGVTMEIDGFINNSFVENDNFIIILTGGDAEFLADRLKNTIFANSNFLLESLNQTFQYNHK